MKTVIRIVFKSGASPGLIKVEAAELNRIRSTFKSTNNHKIVTFKFWRSEESGEMDVDLLETAYIETVQGNTVDEIMAEALQPVLNIN